MLPLMLAVEEMSAEKEKQTAKVLFKFLCLEKMNVCRNIVPTHIQYTDISLYKWTICMLVVLDEMSEVH